MKFFMFLLIMLFLWACTQNTAEQVNAVRPVVTTAPVNLDSDDPAIWVNPDDPGKSLIIGTDKDENGALYVFNLDGTVDEERTVRNLKRPNNVDVEYGLLLNGESLDIAVTTERFTNKIRVFRLPDMIAVDNGGIEVFAGEPLRAPMGISLYKRPSDGAIYAIISRKEGPTDGRYLWQYRLQDDGNGHLIGNKVREFGTWSGVKEIESVAVDDALGFVYYSDESTGVRKYHADPDVENANQELAMFATEPYLEDREGISIYEISDGTGYILVSDQSANSFHVYPREGTAANPHEHPLLKVIPVSTNNSDGSEVTSRRLGDKFPSGLFVAMSDDKTFQIYTWESIAAGELILAPDGTRP